MSKLIAASAIRGAHNIVKEARDIFDKAVQEKGVDCEVAFPNTAYYIPIIYSMTGIAVEKLADFDQVFEAALEAGAEDVKDEGDVYEVITDPADFIEVREAMTATGLQVGTADVAMLPQNQLQLEGKPAETMLKLMDALEDNDDVQNVFANFDISEDELAKIM